jgi:apolipoprotein N-acyltransferase
MPPALRFALAFAATTASAALLGLAYPPTEWRAAAWLALAPFLLALRGVGLRAGLFLGWWWAVLFAWTVGDWMPRAIPEYYHQPAWVGWAFLLAVASTMVSPYVMGFAALYQALARRWHAALPLLAAAAWTTTELARGRLLTGTPFFIGNPWALLGYSQVDWPAAVQVASLTGVYGVGFALAAASAALAELVLWAGRRGATVREAALWLASGILPGAAALGFGLAVLPAWSPETGGEEDPASGPPLPVAVVQGNLDSGSRWRSDLYGQNLETYLRLTWQAHEKSRPRVVFWPEAAMTFFLDQEPLYRRSLASLLGPADLELVAGGPRAAGDEAAPLFFNTVFTISPAGEIVGRYDKEYLVPFAESFPFGSDGLLRRSFGRVRIFEPGTSAAPLPTRIGPAGVAVCNEAMLPEVVSARVAAGAELIVNPEPRFAELLFDIVRLRAVEQRRWLVRASTSGPSAIVDPWGRVQVRSRMDERTTLAGTVRARRGRTVYGRIGDAFAFACAGIVAAACLRRGPRAARRGLTVPM